MQRRDFFRYSTLHVAGLLTARAVWAGSQEKASGPSVGKVAVYCPTTPTSQPAVAGAIQMLRASGREVEVVDRLDGLDPYAVLVLPDVVRLTAPQTAWIETYLNQGGRLLASWQSGLTPEGTAFASERFGLRLVGEARCSPDFVVPGPRLASHTSGNSELLMYRRGMEVAVRTASLLAMAYPPAPLDGAPQPTGYPAITLGQGVAYFAHPVFTQYAHTTPQWCSQLVLATLNQLTQGQHSRLAPPPIG
jgi:hypothetical protein